MRPAPSPGRRRVRATAAALLLLAGTAGAQGWVRTGDEDRGRLFSLPRSQDDIFEWKQAKTELEEGRPSLAVERLHKLRSSAHPGVVPLDERGEAFMGLRAAVLMTLRELTGEGRDEYEQLTKREAGRLLRTAFEGVQPAKLTNLARRFPASGPGVRARLRLGDMALEAGDGITAEFHYRAALDGLAENSDQRVAVGQRMWAAQVVAGSRTHGRLGDDELRVIEQQLAAALPRLSANQRGWMAYGGGGNGAGHMTAPLGNLHLQQAIDVQSSGYRGRSYPMHAVGDLGGIIINDGVRIHCYDPLSAQLVWESAGPLADQPHELDKYLRAVNRDTVLAAACNADVVVAALHVPGEGKNTRYKNIDVIRHIPRRKLFAVDRATGKRLWSHWDHIRGPITRHFDGHDAAGSPLIHGDTVYVPSHDQTGAVSYYLTAYDLHTGKTRWRRLICSSQGEVNMFGNSRREYTASPLAIADGMIFGSTNLGVCFAADAANGSLRWVTAYEVIPLPQTRLTDQQDRRVIFANNPAVVADGVVACTPLDSAYAIGFDIKTGEQVWRLYHRSPAQGANDIRWLLGAQNDEFLFSGLGVVAVKARPIGRSGQPSVRRIRSPESLGLPSDTLITSQAIPRGALTDDRIYYASPAGLRVFNRRGDAKMAKLVSNGHGLGNLLLVDGILVSVRDGSLEFYFDRDQLVRAARDRIREDRDDIAALLRLASLIRGGQTEAESKLASQQTETLLRSALEAAGRAGIGDASPTYRRIAGELFRLSEQRARSLRATHPRPALELMRRARDETLRPEEWLLAQQTILTWVQGQRTTFLAELDLMAREHGSLVYRFAGQVPVPVSSFALWQESIHTPEPIDAIRVCQDLIERFPDVVFDGSPARDIASEHQRQLIAAHGIAVYAAVEERARAALAAAADDPELLAAMSQRFPHSTASRRALAAIMDHAIEQGDLGTAARSYAQATLEGHADAAVTRRMLAAARVAGNIALARELSRRLLANFPDDISDYGPDGGSAMKDAVRAPALPAPYQPPPVHRPFEVIARKDAGSAAVGLRLCRTRLVDGFVSPQVVPILVSVDGRRLQAFDPDAGHRMFDEPLFSVPFQYQEGEDLLMCGETLILPELDRVRGIDTRSGEETWVLSGGTERMLISLGTQAGVLHLFSEMRNAGDGGILLGVEPLSGVVMFRHVFPSTAESTAPASSGGGLWIFRPGQGDTETGLHRLDPLTGEFTHRLALTTPLLRRLGLEDQQTRSWSAHLLHKTLFADEQHVYLPFDGSERSAPRVAALDYDGEESWLWRGMRGREIPMVALHGGHVVIVERGSRGSRVVLLDSNSGALRREKQLGPTLSVRNWSRTERSRPAPDHLMMVDHAVNLQIDVTCYHLDGRAGSFRLRLHGRHEHVVWEPLIGEDFVAIAARRRDDAQLTLFVLDLKSRRSVLPDNKHQLRIQGNPPFKMLAVHPYVAIQHAGGISVFGELEKSRK